MKEKGSKLVQTMKNLSNDTNDKTGLILYLDYQTVLPDNNCKHEGPHAENIVGLSTMILMTY